MLRRACASLAIALAMACASSGGDVQPISDPSGRPSGPTVPVPSSLWQPPAGSTPATGSYAYLDMDASFSPGVTYPHTIVSATGGITVSASGGQLSVSAEDTVTKLAMIGVFQTMLGKTQLEVGYYHDLHGALEADPLFGALDVMLNLRRCGSLSGWFAIDHVFYFQGHLTAFDLRFEERCSGFVAPMHGQVHWTENNT